ncbi:SIMPL domain-containing protein [Candidatus Woesearchaeota archaeon]|nr:SIMPL domain-containing protein [Candidatus Woesearchaeota archaeon]HIH25889.1 SIMPL domain-containing protein [Nanoarchaeota archaeon]
MENKNNILTIILALGIIVLSVFSVYSFTQKDIPLGDKKTISVSGSSTMDVVPDQAMIYFRIETIDLDPKVAQSKNSDISNNFIKLLKSNGLSDNDIETIYFNLEKSRVWENNKYVDKGYRSSHTIKVTLKDTSKAGEIINLGVNNNINNVDNVVFSLSKDRQNDIKVSMLSTAISDAKTKAEQIADAADSSVKGLVSVVENSNNYYPMYYSAMSEAKVTSADMSVAPELQPKSVSLTVSVSAVFEIS